MLRRMGLPVHDADAAVHRLLGPGGAAVALVGRAFPGVVGDGAVDRAKLAARVFGRPDELRRLERILHPMVRQAARGFLRRCARARRPLAVLDIPLLFESGGEALCDLVVTLSAPPFVQTARVLARRNMTRARFRAILATQMSDGEKRRRADVIVETGLSKRATLRQLRRAVRLATQGRRREH